jgi:hypothetical protein
MSVEVSADTTRRFGLIAPRREDAVEFRPHA